MQISQSDLLFYNNSPEYSMLVDNVDCHCQYFTSTKFGAEPFNGAGYTICNRDSLVTGDVCMISRSCRLRGWGCSCYCYSKMMERELVLVGWMSLAQETDGSCAGIRWRRSGLRGCCNTGGSCEVVQICLLKECMQDLAECRISESVLHHGLEI